LLQPVESSNILVEVISVIGGRNPTLSDDALELQATATSEPGCAREAGSM
jgi:hypothetical protein